MAGWGKTENGTLSDTLQAARLPYIEFKKCYDSVHMDFARSITQDKFCAGYQNGKYVKDYIHKVTVNKYVHSAT